MKRSASTRPLAPAATATAAAMLHIAACTQFSATPDTARDAEVVASDTDADDAPVDAGPLYDAAGRADSFAPDADQRRAFYWAFVSPDTFNGDLARGGAALAKMDQYCTVQGRLAFGGSERTKYLVYLSTTPAAPGARFVGLGPWRLATGVEVFSSQGDFVGGARAAFNQFPNGAEAGAPFQVWTGMTPNGSPGPTCPNWATADGGILAATGDARSKGTRWQFASNLPCSSQARVYCLEAVR